MPSGIKARFGALTRDLSAALIGVDARAQFPICVGNSSVGRAAGVCTDTVKLLK
jgi:hypothetical protein